MAVNYAPILHVEVGCSVVCDCCIFCSYSLAFCTHSDMSRIRDIQQCDILTSVDAAEPVQPPFKLRNSE